MVHPMDVMGRPVVVMDAFPLHGEPWCLSSPLSSALGLSRHHRCGVLELFPSCTGTLFFIAVYFVEGLDDLVDVRHL